jgi:predicted nucleic acid-binding protein
MVRANEWYVSKVAAVFRPAPKSSVTWKIVTQAARLREVLHRFVAIRRPELGARIARDALDLFAPVLPITHGVMDRMPKLVEVYPELAARDLVHVATCLENGLGAIVSPDRGLDAVREIRRIEPADVDAAAP